MKNLEQLHQKVFELCKNGILILKREYKPMNLEGEYETLILSSLVSLKALNETFRNEYKQIETLFFQLLVDEGLNNGLFQDKSTLVNFINKRFSVFNKEISKIYEGEGTLPANIFSAIYSTPLRETLEHNSDLIELLEFFNGLSSMLIFIEENIDNITSKRNDNNIDAFLTAFSKNPWHDDADGNPARDEDRILEIEKYNKLYYNNNSEFVADMLLIAKKLTNSIIKEYPKISKFGKFEALIYCSVITYILFADKFPEHRKRIIIGFKHILILEHQSINFSLSEIESENFVTNRIIEFSNEINSLDSGYTYNSIFVNPLQLDPGKDFDSDLLLRFRLFSRARIEGVCKNIFDTLQIEINI